MQRSTGARFLRFASAAFLFVLLAGLPALTRTAGAAEVARRPARLDSLRDAADAARRAVIAAERAVEAEAKPETIIVATRKPNKSVKVDLGKRGTMTIDGDASHGDKVLMGDDLTVEADEVVGGDAVSMGGDITVLGKVMGSVVSVGGDVTLGDSAFVGEDAVSVGGSVTRAETAVVAGKVVEVDGPGFPGMFPPRKPGNESIGGRMTNLVQLIVFYLVLFAFAALALYLARQRIEYASDYLSREPIPSFLLGLISPILLLLGFVLLCITLIGIPVALALLVLYPAFIFVGWVVAGYRIGRSINPGEPPLRTLFAGLLVLGGLHLLYGFLKLLGVSGFLTFAVAFTGIAISSLGAFAGLGAILGTKFRRAPLTPPPTAGGFDVSAAPPVYATPVYAPPAYPPTSSAPPTPTAPTAPPVPPSPPPIA